MRLHELSVSILHLNPDAALAHILERRKLRREVASARKVVSAAKEKKSGESVTVKRQALAVQIAAVESVEDIDAMIAALQAKKNETTT